MKKAQETWFTSDWHLGHKNILEFEAEKRPFADLDHMHHEMIKRHNSVVGKYDLVYHLGDVCWKKEYMPLLDEFNGEKRLIMGNHDQFKMEVYLQYFEKIYGVKYWERCTLTHIPIHQNSLSGRFMLNVHGHLHSNNVKSEMTQVMGGKKTIYAVEDINYFNVSVEQNDLMPFHADQILERIKQIDS